MGLFEFIKRLLFGSPAPTTATQSGDDSPLERPAESGSASAATSAMTPAEQHRQRMRYQSRQRNVGRRERVRVSLRPLRYESSLVPTSASREQVAEKPYLFATCSVDPRQGPRHGYLDLSQDADPRWLEYYGLPVLRTPQDLADWLQIPVGRLAWLTQRQHRERRPPTVREAHYHYQWIRKRTDGHRLIEAPKEKLKAVQTQILEGILNHVPPHPAAHGFVEGRSIVTNARPHVGQRFVLKFDLENFYTTVRYSRVVGIFRSLGFSREVSLWLARLTTTALPEQVKNPEGLPGWHWSLAPYRAAHLPQGAPTSPALANLSAYGLDVRLQGLAKTYHVNYTRYADDLTFSGEARVLPALSEFIPLCQRIVRSERFVLNLRKRRLVRSNQRQVVTGVVVNQRTNVSRREYDRLKATLHNCLRQGPQSQNREDVENFAAHLRGRIAHVTQLNPARGAKLLEMFQRIHWTG